jgi:hypothetical protein
MVVDRSALWIVMGLCSITGVVVMVHMKLRTAPPQGRLRRVGTVLGAMLDGVGVGLTVALIILLTAAAVVRVEDLLR